MRLTEREIQIPAAPDHRDMLGHVRKALAFRLADGAMPVRFALTRMAGAGYDCEVGIFEDLDSARAEALDSVFRFAPRAMARTDSFNAVFVVPTGIGAEIGGHAGDATPVARVLAEACDTLITHPNVVNASDLNEIPDNALYVEGSALARLLMGTLGLARARSNRVLVLMDEHEDAIFANDTVNAVSAARATYGLDCPAVIKLDPPLRLTAKHARSGRAAGEVAGLERVCAVLDEFAGIYDAVAIASVIEVAGDTHAAYFAGGGVTINPWGGVEAMLTHALSLLYEVPVAHSPMMESMEIANLDLGRVEPRLAAEAVSMTFLQCMLKGLHRAPRLVTDLDIMRTPGVITAADVSCLVIPDGCVGLPTLAALEQGIPVIAVRDNANLMRNDLAALPWRPGQLHMVENHWEAVGVMTALRAGVAPEALRRPLAATRVETRSFGNAAAAPHDARRNRRS